MRTLEAFVAACRDLGTDHSGDQIYEWFEALPPRVHLEAFRIAGSKIPGGVESSPEPVRATMGVLGEIYGIQCLKDY